MKKIINQNREIIIILFVLLLAAVLSMSQTYKKVTVCKIASSAQESQEYIITKSKEGYRLLSLTAYHNGSSSFNNFIIVMER